MNILSANQIKFDRFGITTQYIELPSSQKTRANAKPMILQVP
jgi:hypothetical protein